MAAEKAGPVPLVGAAAAAADDTPRREYLSFLLAGEAYANDILRVQEIRSVERITRVARVAPFIKGVTNLRGVIVPVMDLRMRFGLPEVPYNAFSVMIVLSLQGRLAGVVVDSVEDVLAVADEELLSAPALGSHVAAAFVRGLVSLEGQMFVVLDAEGLLTAPESGLLGNVA